MRVSELQYLVYFCNIHIYYNQDMDKHIPTFEEMETNESGEPQPQRHFGNILPLSWREDGEPKYALGPHYVMFLMTLILSSLFVIAIGYSIVTHSKKGKLQMSIAICISILFYIYSYVKVGFSNPGLASSWQEPPEEVKSDHRYCVPCRIVRPLKTVHCYSCDICILQYDHHCPWVGKCIGRDNYCQFRCFLFSAMQLLCIFSICMYFGEEQTVPMKG